jgi:hypothetical protein
VSIFDHAEQRVRFGHPVDHEVSLEDLVAAVLAVGLSEHHQLDVRRITSELLEGAHEVVDFVRIEREPERRVGGNQRGPAASDHAHAPERAWRSVSEELLCFGQASEHAFGHPIVQQRQDALLIARRELTLEAVNDAALHPVDHRQSGAAGNVGRLGRPGRQRAEARQHQPQRAGFRQWLAC